MEKKFFRFFLILFTIISSFGLASCDDDDVSDAELMEILQQHKWIMRDAELNLYGDDELELRREGHYLYFYSDDEGFEVTVTKIIDTEGSDTWNRDFSKFTYSVSDNIVYLRYVGSGNRTLTYSDGNLLYSSIVYVPLSLNSSDSSVIQEGKISGDYNFDYSIGFDHDYMSQPYYSNGKYHWSIPMSFGIPRNTYKRGVRDFGIAVYVSGGTVDNQTKKYSMDAYVTLRKVNGQDTKCFSHTVSDDTPQDWDTKLSISTTGKSFTLYYTWFLINKEGDYIDGDSFLQEKFEADGTTNDDSDDNTDVSDDDSRDARSGQSFTVTAGGVTFKMIGVSGGTFQMGSNDNWDDEKPVHRVTLSDFSIGQTEVTQELWYAVMGYRPTSGGSQWTSQCGLGDKYPAYYISWNDCQEFIGKLNRLTGRTFRMPTEAEWEYAARGGNSSRGYMYSGSNTVGDVAWHFDNSGGTTHKVATKQPNELGIYDMSGNVWEWCSDWYDKNYYSSSSSTNPKGPSSGSYRVYRGGSWFGFSGVRRVASRSYSTPSRTHPDLGLRLAL